MIEFDNFLELIQWFNSKINRAKYLIFIAFDLYNNLNTLKNGKNEDKKSLICIFGSHCCFINWWIDKNDFAQYFL